MFMKQSDVIKQIRNHQAALEAAGARSVYLFGSFARDEADSSSDIDIAIDIDYQRKPNFSLLDLTTIAHIIEDATDRHTDVLVRKGLKRIRESFEADAVEVYAVAN